MRRRLIVSACAASMMVAPAPARVSEAQTAGADCSVASLQARAPAGTTITATAVVAATDRLPQHCLVDGTVATPGNAVAFRLGLPANWNNKFYFEGVGGFGGSIGSLTAGLTRGYASASTDTGHQGSATDASWALNNPAKEIDYAHRGTHVTTVAAKALSAAYYGRAPRFSYFNGCSNGGRQALTAAQRYPEDFDGIIAGNPALGTYGQVRRALTYQRLLSSADRYLPASKLKVVADAVKASCDAGDGLADGLISDPQACGFRPETLTCAASGGPDCLTPGQVETLEAIYSDITGPGGVVLPGFPMGHEDGPTGWQAWITGAAAPVERPAGTLEFARNAPLGFRFQESFLKYLAFPESDADYDWRAFNLEREAARLAVDLQALSPTDANLSPFQARGGKLLLYHGWADPGISAFGTIRYYDAAVQQAGGRERADQFLKLFMAPGMHHCQGNGPGPNTFDMLTALEQWVEGGVSPASVIATHATNGVVDRSRPLCAYPMIARYRGTGSVDAAGNFLCEAPRPAEPSSASAVMVAPQGSGGGPRTPWGDPDLQGTWSSEAELSVPFERPREYGTRQLLTDEEFAQRQALASKQLLSDNADFDLETADTSNAGQVGSATSPPPHWLERAKVSRRTSLVIDPPDGRLPAATQQGQSRGRAGGGTFGANPVFNGPGDLSLWERCITRGVPGAIFPTVYNANVRIVQAPGSVAITYEMIHDTRVIPIGDGAHVGSAIRGYHGDARGRWEGDTLVVDTTNFSEKSSYRGSRETLHLIERFTRTGDGIRYEVTVDDPSTWTRPWTAALTLAPQPDGALFEYACHEGNHAMRNILSAARAADRR